MSNFGSTSEIDGIDRGPPEEDRKTEAELRGMMQDISKAKSTMGELATIKGIKEEMIILRQLVQDMTEQHNRIIGLYSTLRGEFDQFKQQRAIELNSWLAKGQSTTPEDN